VTSGKEPGSGKWLVIVSFLRVCVSGVAFFALLGKNVGYANLKTGFFVLKIFLNFSKKIYQNSPQIFSKNTMSPKTLTSTCIGSLLVASCFASNK
jgi:hypothetical protein